MPNSWGSLAGLLGESAPAIRIVDVGALCLGEWVHPYDSLLQTGKASVVGFEPIEEECRALNQRFGQQRCHYLPYAIGDGTKRSFHRCNFPMTSSLLQPDLQWMDLFHELPQYCQVTSVQEINTYRLDDVREISGVDYLKIDVQGAELDVLKGATRTLRDTLVIQTEVEFVPIYRNQPLFAEVDQFLRAHGFMFHKFVGMEGRFLEAVGTARKFPGSSPQLLWADAVYIRPVPEWSHLPDESLLRLALILHELYGSLDFSARLLRTYDDRTGSHYWPEYMRMIEIACEKGAGD